jgi:hypothetical protein
VNDYEVTPERVIAALAFYAGLFLIIRTTRHRIDPIERRTFIAIAAVWAPSVFVANYLLHLADLMSFLPWVTNFLHTFVWIGFCLTWLYLGVRETEPMWVQFVIFATFSLAVKVVEQSLFGTWEHDNFFGIDGNAAYVVGWSLADGLYPPLTLLGLRLASTRIPRLVTT